MWMNEAPAFQSAPMGHQHHSVVTPLLHTPMFACGTNGLIFVGYCAARYRPDLQYVHVEQVDPVITPLTGPGGSGNDNTGYEYASRGKGKNSVRPGNDTVGDKGSSTGHKTDTSRYGRDETSSVADDSICRRSDTNSRRYGMGLEDPKLVQQETKVIPKEQNQATDTEHGSQKNEPNTVGDRPIPSESDTDVRRNESGQGNENDPSQHTESSNGYGHRSTGHGRDSPGREPQSTSHDIVSREQKYSHAGPGAGLVSFPLADVYGFGRAPVGYTPIFACHSTGLAYLGYGYMECRPGFGYGLNKDTGIISMDKGIVGGNVYGSTGYKSIPSARRLGVGCRQEKKSSPRHGMNPRKHERDSKTGETGSLADENSSKKDQGDTNTKDTSTVADEKGSRNDEDEYQINETSSVADENASRKDKDDSIVNEMSSVKNESSSTTGTAFTNGQFSSLPKDTSLAYQRDAYVNCNTCCDVFKLSVGSYFKTGWSEHVQSQQHQERETEKKATDLEKAVDRHLAARQSQKSKTASRGNQTGSRTDETGIPAWDTYQRRDGSVSGARETDSKEYQHTCEFICTLRDLRIIWHVSSYKKQQANVTTTEHHDSCNSGGLVSPSGVGFDPLEDVSGGDSGTHPKQRECVWCSEVLWGYLTDLYAVKERLLRRTCEVAATHECIPDDDPFSSHSLRTETLRIVPLQRLFESWQREDLPAQWSEKTVNIRCKDFMQFMEKDELAKGSSKVYCAHLAVPEEHFFPAVLSQRGEDIDQELIPLASTQERSHEMMLEGTNRSLEVLNVSESGDHGADQSKENTIWVTNNGHTLQIQDVSKSPELGTDEKNEEVTSVKESRSSETPSLEAPGISESEEPRTETCREESFTEYPTSERPSLGELDIFKSVDDRTDKHEEEGDFADNPTSELPTNERSYKPSIVHYDKKERKKQLKEKEKRIKLQRSRHFQRKKTSNKNTPSGKPSLRKTEDTEENPTKEQKKDEQSAKNPTKQNEEVAQSLVKNQDIEVQNTQNLTKEQNKDEEATQNLTNEQNKDEEATQNLTNEQNKDEEATQNLTKEQNKDEEATQNLTKEQNKDEEATQNLTNERDKDEETTQNLTKEQNKDEEATQNLTKEQNEDEEATQNLTNEQKKDEEATQNLTKEQNKDEEATQNLTKEQNKDEEATQNLTKEQNEDEEATQNLTKEQNEDEEATQNLTKEPNEDEEVTQDLTKEPNEDEEATQDLTKEQNKDEEATQDLAKEQNEDEEATQDLTKEQNEDQQSLEFLPTEQGKDKEARERFLHNSEKEQHVEEKTREREQTIVSMTKKQSEQLPTSKSPTNRGRMNQSAHVEASVWVSHDKSRYPTTNTVPTMEEQAISQPGDDQTKTPTEDEENSEAYNTLQLRRNKQSEETQTQSVDKKMEKKELPVKERHDERQTNKQNQQSSELTEEQTRKQSEEHTNKQSEQQTTERHSQQEWKEQSNEQQSVVDHSTGRFEDGLSEVLSSEEQRNESPERRQPEKQSANKQAEEQVKEQTSTQRTEQQTDEPPTERQNSDRETKEQTTQQQQTRTPRAEAQHADKQRTERQATDHEPPERNIHGQSSEQLRSGQPQREEPSGRPKERANRDAHEATELYNGGKDEKKSDREERGELQRAKEPEPTKEKPQTSEGVSQEHDQPVTASSRLPGTQDEVTDSAQDGDLDSGQRIANSEGDRDSEPPQVLREHQGEPRGSPATPPTHNLHATPSSRHSQGASPLPPATTPPGFHACPDPHQAKVSRLLCDLSSLQQRLGALETQSKTYEDLILQTRDTFHQGFAAMKGKHSAVFARVGLAVRNSFGAMLDEISRQPKSAEEKGNNRLTEFGRSVREG